MNTTNLNMSNVCFLRRFKLIVLMVSLWFIFDLLSILIYYDFAYEFGTTILYYPDDLIYKTFFVLPKAIQSLIEAYPYYITLILLFTCLNLAILGPTIFGLFVLFFLGNFHYCITYLLTSGATTLMINSTTFLLILSILIKYESKHTYIAVTKDYLFLAFKIQLSMVYFISWFAKIISPLWRSGAATYYIFNNQRYSNFPILMNYFNKYDFLIKISTISALAFLSIFPFIIWTKRKMPFIYMSLVFHGVIAFYMGLYEFMIFPIMDLLLFSDDVYIEKIYSYFFRTVKLLTINRKEKLCLEK